MGRIFPKSGNDDFLSIIFCVEPFLVIVQYDYQPISMETVDLIILV